MIRYIGLLKQKHTAFNFKTLRLHYVKFCTAEYKEQNLLKPVKSFEITLNIIENLKKVLLKNSKELQQAIVNFINDSKFITLKLHTLDYLKLPLAEKQKIIQYKEKHHVQSYEELTRVTKANLLVVFIKIICEEMKTNKYLVTTYLINLKDDSNKN